MYAFCVMLNACVLSHVLYMSFACLLSKESNKQKKLQISQLCRVPTLGKEVFAECQGCGTRQSWEKMPQKTATSPVLPSATAWHSAKRSILPSVTAWHSAKRYILPSATVWHSAKRSILPSARWYHSAKTIFKKIFFLKIVSLPSAQPWLSAKIQILPSASP